MKQRQGSVVLDKRSGQWNFYFWRDGKRHSQKIGCLRDYPNKTQAWRACRELRVAVETNYTKALNLEGVNTSTTPTVRYLVEEFKKERMPARVSTARGYCAWIDNYVTPHWGDRKITDVSARQVEGWLQSIDHLAPKSKVHIRNLIGSLWNYAMWSGAIPTQVNPMSLVKVKGASKRKRIPRVLSPEEFSSFQRQLPQPLRELALVSACCGLRISEGLALRWCDLDEDNNELQIERGVVRGQIDDTKTSGSARSMAVDPRLLAILKVWKDVTQFSGAQDWIFASPAKLGRLPWSYPHVLKQFHRAADAARIGPVTPHTLRHSFRAWLDSLGTGISAQRELMRHASIMTTFDVYGRKITPEMRQAAGKVAALALNGR